MSRKTPAYNHTAVSGTMTISMKVPITEAMRIKQEAQRQGTTMSDILRMMVYENKMHNGGVIEAVENPDIKRLQNENAALKGEIERLIRNSKPVINIGSNSENQSLQQKNDLIKDCMRFFKDNRAMDDLKMIEEYHPSAYAERACQMWNEHHQKINSAAVILMQRCFNELSKKQH